MSFCTKCGTEVAADVTFCSKCGNKLQGEQNSPPAQIAEAKLAIWNPTASASWGFLLPFFPMIIHYLNWKKLEKYFELDVRPNKEIRACIGYLLFMFIAAYLFTPREAGVVIFIIFLIWYFKVGKVQIKYVKERFGTKYSKKSLLPPLAIAIGGFLGLIILIGVIQEPENVKIVKKGSMQACPQHTVEKMVDSFMANPKWEHIGASDGKDYVNISGGIGYNTPPARGALQFWVKGKEFGINAFEIDGIPQNITVDGLIQVMCESATEKPAKSKDESYKNHFKDPRDGKKYGTVQIGNQVWMAQNLDYHGSDGFLGLCYGDKPKEKIREPKNCKKYGRLYNWEEAKEACPSGWHLPRDEDWQILVDFAGGDEVAGKKLKAKSGWKEHDFSEKSMDDPKCKWEEIDDRGRSLERNECATDEYGFSALPGGGYGTSFIGAGNFGSWWSSTEDGSGNAYRRGMNYVSSEVFRVNNGKSGLFSVRCLQD